MSFTDLPDVTEEVTELRFKFSYDSCIDELVSKYFPNILTI